MATSALTGATEVPDPGTRALSCSIFLPLTNMGSIYKLKIKTFPHNLLPKGFKTGLNAQRQCIQRHLCAGAQTHTQGLKASGCSQIYF